MSFHNLTKEQLADYLKCLQNLKAGDRVDVYVKDGTYSINHKSNCVVDLEVLCNVPGDIATDSIRGTIYKPCFPSIILESRVGNGAGFPISGGWIQFWDSLIRKYCPPHRLGTSTFKAITTYVLIKTIYKAPV